MEHLPDRRRPAGRSGVRLTRPRWVRRSEPAVGRVITGYQFASNGTVPQGDRVFFDDLGTTSGRDFEPEPVGAVPRAARLRRARRPPWSATCRAHSGIAVAAPERSGDGQQTVISCPAVPQQGIDLRFAAYPVALRNGFLVSLRGHFEGLAEPQLVFHLAVVADGSLRWYDGCRVDDRDDAGGGADRGLERDRASVGGRPGIRRDPGERSPRGPPVGRSGCGASWIIIGFDFSSYGTATTGRRRLRRRLVGRRCARRTSARCCRRRPAVTIEQATGRCCRCRTASVTTGPERS